MSRHVSLKLLGAPLVEREGRAVTFATRKALALLALLAVTPGPHSRAVLAAMLWPEHDQQHSAGALRYTLAVLKKALGEESLAITRDSVALRVGPEASDVGQFQRCLAEVNAHGHRAPEPCPTCLAALTRGVQLYGGDFLEGFALRDSPAFDEWQLIQCQRFQRDLAAALEWLATAHAAGHEWGPATEHARRWTALDPLHESAQRLLMQVFAWSGRRTAALRQYQTYAALLAAELGIQPAEETAALYEAIKARELSRPPAPARASARSAGEPAPPAPLLPPLVAREREVRAFEDDLARTVAGHACVRLVAGEAGSGKTTLLQMFAQRAMVSSPQFVVAAASCDAYTGAGDPLRPFRTVLSVLMGERGPDAPGTIGLPGPRFKQPRLEGPVRDVLAELGTDVAATLLAEGPPTEAETTDAPTPDRRALFARYNELLRRLAARQPLLLILDDLHWADSASLDLLGHLSRALAGSAICIVGAYRPAALVRAPGAGPHPLEALLHELLRTRGEVRVDLDRAAEEAGQAFVDALVATLPNRLGDDFRHALFRQTAGHPLFTVELLRGLQERGDLVLDQDGRWMTSAAVDWSRLPARVEGMIAERLAHLDEGLRELLQIASVEGETFSAETLAFVQATDERGVVRALSGELERRQRLVRALGVTPLGPSGLARYRFRHALFQQYLYRQLDPVERAQLHGEVGAALERLAGEQAEMFAVELARHFAEAGHTFKAVRYLLLAGRRAFRLTAGEEALDHLRHGIRLLQAVPSSPERAQYESQLQVVLGAALTQLHGQASAGADAAFGQAHRLSAGASDRRELFLALWGRKSVHDIRAEYHAALAIVDQLEALAEEDDRRLLRPVVDSTRGVTLLYIGELAPARLHLERAIAAYDPRLHRDLALQHGTDIGIVSHAWLAAAFWEQGFPDQARRQSEVTLALARGLGQPYNEVYALTIGGRAFQRGRDAAATRRWTEEAVALIPEGQFAMFHALATAWHGWSVAAMGDLEGGLAEMRRGYEAIRATGARVSEAGMQVLLAGVYLRAGRLRAALEAVDAAQAVAEETDTRLDLIEAHRLRGELLEVDDPAGAETSVRRAINLATSNGARLLELRASVTLTAILKRQGRAGEARALLAPCYSRFTEGFDAHDLRAAREALAALAGDQPSERPPEAFSQVGATEGAAGRGA